MGVDVNAIPRRRRARARRRERSGRRWLWLTLSVGLACGAVALLMRGEDAPPPSLAVSAAPAAPPAAAPAAGASSLPKPVREGFEFYQLLPNDEVIIPEAELRSPSPPAASATPVDARLTAPVTPSTSPPAMNGLQVGAFRRHAPADALRARLALADIAATIRTRADAQGRTWYRVQLGPYADRAELAAARDRLSAMGITALPLPWRR